MDQTPASPQIPADLPGDPRALTPRAPGSVGVVEQTQKSRDDDHRPDLGLRGVRDHEVPGICDGKCRRAGGFPNTSKCPVKQIAV
ncbi:hypothetical protein [Arthrobacter sp. LAR12-1-1.1]|uniref:hypothetical protein n=1 Tax=Arthrobacter sp. LAR12-1-1.1 TaxID=3135215 RepID=UPI00343AE036